jgi:thymidine kinase
MKKSFSVLICLSFFLFSLNQTHAQAVSREQLQQELAELEAQFLNPEQVKQLHQMAHKDNIPVICFGLRTDFRGEPFPGSVALLTLADDLEEMKAICACARKATMQIRLDKNGRRVKEGLQVEIGGNDRYRAVCPSCFYAHDDDTMLTAPGLFG